MDSAIISNSASNTTSFPYIILVDECLGIVHVGIITVPTLVNIPQLTKLVFIGNLTYPVFWLVGYDP